MPSQTRNKLVALRVSPDEVAMLQDLADADGVNHSTAIRMALRRTHEARFGARKPKARKRPKH